MVAPLLIMTIDVKIARTDRRCRQQCPQQGLDTLGDDC